MLVHCHYIGRVHPPPSKILVYSLSRKTGQGFFLYRMYGTEFSNLSVSPLLNTSLSGSLCFLVIQLEYLCFHFLVNLETPHILFFYTDLCLHHHADRVSMDPSPLPDPFSQNALSFGVLSLIGCQILSHLLFSVKSKACWLMKSSVLDSTILRERHKISIGKSLLALLLCFPQQ